MLWSTSSRCCRRGGANSATLLIVLLAQYYYPSCAFLTPSTASTTSRSNLGLLSGTFQNEYRQSLHQIISLSSSSVPPSTSEPSARSQPPPKPARTPAAISQKSTRATPASSTSSPLLAFGGRVKRKIEVEEASPGSPRAEGLPAEKIGKGEEKQEDVRKSARWGGKPSSPPNPGVGLMINPLQTAGSSLKAIGRGATAAKDVLYDAADGISAVGGLSTEIIRQRGDGSSKGPTVGNTVRVANNTGSKGGGFVGALKIVGGGAVIAKDALWSAIDLLGDAADALGKAPDTARSVAEGGRATLQAAKANVEAVARAPGAAVGAASDAVGSIAKVIGGIKDSAYGVADATARLASLPGEVAERRRLEQQERERIEAEREAKQKENARKFASTVTSTKDLVWSTIDGVGTFADTVVSAPATVSEGLGKAQDAVVSAGELLGSIPRTVQEIPLEAQRKVDGVIASVESVQDTGKAVALTVGSTIDGASRIVQKGVDIATGKERRERQEREQRAVEERRKEKERNALLRIQGEPYTAQDLAIGALKTVGIAAKSAFGVGKAFVTVASAVPSAPAKVARTVLGPLYEYQQSTKRVRDAVEEEASSRPSALIASVTEIAPTAPTADVPFGGNDTPASENQDDRVKEGVPSVMEGNIQGGDARTVEGIEDRKARRSWDKFDARKK